MTRISLPFAFTRSNCSSAMCRCGVSTIVRLLHTSLCLAIAGSLLWKDTELKRALINMDNPLYGGIYILVFFASLALYFATALTDPGYVPIAQYRKRLGRTLGHDHVESSESDTEYVEMENVESELVKKKYKYRFCDYCEIQPPLRAKHCEDCKLCVRRYDHHCPWLEACIGEGNHKYFWGFLLVTSVLVVWTFIIVWNGFVTKDTWSDWLHVNVVLFLDSFVLILGGPMVVALLMFHTYLMLNGLSTWEVASRERISYLRYLGDEPNPFDEGCLRNIYFFLCYFKTRTWESLYAKKARFKFNGSSV